MDSKKIKPNSLGFTLIEIIVVVAIISLLAAIAFIVINPNKRIGESQDIKRASDLTALAKAVDNYTADYRELPSDFNIATINIGDKVVLCSSSQSLTCDGQTNDCLVVDDASFLGVYLSQLPVDPSKEDTTDTGYYITRTDANLIAFGACDSYDTDNAPEVACGAHMLAYETASSYGDDVTFTYNGSPVTYGSVQNPTTGKCWLDRNLGATQVATALDDAAAYGDLLQWGRDDDGHQVRTSGTTSVNSSSDDPGHGNFITESISPYDWRVPQNDSLWQGESGTNNPCPSGWRIPTGAEWEAEVASWVAGSSAGAFASPLKLTVAGYRLNTGGISSLVGSVGGYWQSLVEGILPGSLKIDSSNAFIDYKYRSYGLSVRCISIEDGETPPPSINDCGVLTDTRDGQTYDTVEIGTQCWTRENMNIGTYVTVSQTNNDIIEKYCYNDVEANCSSFGGLYSAQEAFQYVSGCNGSGESQPECTSPVQGICPAGWHIPSHYEWTALERAVCTSGTCSSDFPFDTSTTGERGTDEGTKLKTGGTSGLELLLGGYKDSSYSYSNIDTHGRFWTSTIEGSTLPFIYYRQVQSTLSTVNRGFSSVSYSSYVRCIKDFSCGDDVTFTYNGSSVTYGSVENSTTSECWLDRNLGATQVATWYGDDDAHGDLFQWGRGDDGHQIRTSGTTSVNSSSDDPGHSDFILETVSPYDWRVPQNDSLWQGVSGANNPCPSGWRIPTEIEWEAERLSWSNNGTFGAFNSPLKLTSTGKRIYSDGSLDDVNWYGYYWSSNLSGSSSRGLYFFDDAAGIYNPYRANGQAIRCIED